MDAKPLPPRQAPLRSKYLVNIDSDGEGVFTVGCAGGVRCDMERTVSYLPKATKALKVAVCGGQGGHSGVDIHRGRANAIKVLAHDGHHLGYVPRDMTLEVRKYFVLPCACYIYIGKNDNKFYSDCYAIIR